MEKKNQNTIDTFKGIKAIAFDADDTLWALQNYFEDVEHEYCELLSAYGREKEKACHCVLHRHSLPPQTKRFGKNTIFSLKNLEKSLLL